MQLTLYLMREGVELQKEILRDPERFEEVSLAPSDEAIWQLYVNPGVLREASWVKHVRAIAVSDLSYLKNRTTSGILLVEAHGRVFAVTFGHGFQAINSQLIEPGFGLRVTANSVASNQVTSADTRGYSKTGRSQRTVLPAASDLYLLGIEPNEEWVRKLSGKTDESFAASAVGADSLRLKVKDFDLGKLPAKLRDIIAHHNSEAYKEHYAFLDNLQRLVADDPLVEELDEKVRELLRRRDGDLGFAAPDPFEQERIDRYVFKYRRREAVSEFLSVEEVFSALDVLGTTPDDLTKIHVRAFDDNDIPVGRPYELREYIQAEIPGGADSRYVLSAGVWFRVATSWVKTVNDYVTDLSDLTQALQLPDWNKEELSQADDTAEGRYNAVLAERPGYLLLDKKNVPIGGPNQKVEICDILTVNRELICVKRATRSSTLSHLFAQGSVSASLMPDPDYQTHVMNHMTELDPAALYDNPTLWIFVYALATEKRGTIADGLFFFSKVNLMKHAKDIGSRGFGVAVAKIQMV